MSRLFFVFAISFALSAAAQTPQSLPTKDFTVCGLKLKLEIADNFDSRQIGLMHRKGVPAGTGMLFVFDQEEVLGFWMKNVPFDIDIAFFDAKGALTAAKTMKGTSPLQRTESLPNYSSEKPALYAVEAQAGLFAKLKPKCRLEPLPARSKR